MTVSNGLITQNGNSNSYITVREFYEAQAKQSKEREETELRILKKIDEVKNCIPDGKAVEIAQTRADKAHERINALQVINYSWNGINSLGAVLAGILGVGIK